MQTGSDGGGRDRVRLAVAAASLVLILAYSGLRPPGRFTWLAEVSPVLIGLPILVQIMAPAFGFAAPFRFQ